ncbi:MAG: hypothetical protein IPK59_16945 [Rhodospirillaceae bacterium]|nr:hypothetical protein [Rhodospirillaceae bacterium]
MLPTGKSIWLAIAVATMFCAAGMPYPAAADGPPTYRIHCSGATYGVDRVICDNLALTLSYNKIIRALDGKRGIYYADNIGNGIPKGSAMVHLARAQWGRDCDIAPAHGRDPAFSRMTTACLVDSLRSAHFSIRCPLFLTLVGLPSEAQQRKWGDLNQDFCEEEARLQFAEPE